MYRYIDHRYTREILKVSDAGKISLTPSMESISSDLEEIRMPFQRDISTLLVHLYLYTYTNANPTRTH